MLKYLFISLTLLFINCSYLQTNENETTQATFQNIDTIESSRDNVNLSMLDSFKIAKLKEYAKDWDASYFPLPSPAMLKYSPTEDPGYVYVSNSFDSLSYHNSTEKERSAEQPCSWKQKFKSGITYSKSTCKAGGTNYSISTSSSDKKTLIRLIDMLFYTSVNDWNKDSTEYAPLSEKTGCYYKLERTDSGYYNLEYSCSF